MKESEFNKAHTVVKSKNVNQYHYKWGHVCIVINYIDFDYLFILQLCAIYKAVLQWDKKSGSGWHDDYGANAQTPSEKEVLEEFVKTPEVR